MARLDRRIGSTGGLTVHVGLYLVAGTLLILVNVFQSPESLWFWQPLAVWGLVFSLHGLVVALRSEPGRALLAMLLESPWERVPVTPPQWNLPGQAERSLRQLRETWSRALPIPRGSENGDRSVVDPVFPTPFVRRAITSAGEWIRASTPPVSGGAGPSGGIPEPMTPDAGPPASTWPDPPPAWAASWPGYAVVAPATPVVPTNGVDTVLEAVPDVDPDNPQWDRLEVAAANWLAQRSSELSDEGAP